MFLPPTEYQDVFYLHHAGFKILTLKTSLKPKIELFVDCVQTEIFIVFTSGPCYYQDAIQQAFQQ